MDSFSARLAVWLAANESDRRFGLFAVCVIAFLSGYVSFKGFMVLGGVCLMIEGLATLIGAGAASGKSAGRR